MSNVSLFVAILLIAIGGVTYALMRLAPNSVPLPRGAVAATRIFRAVAEHADIVGISIAAILALTAVIWVVVTYPAVLAIAVTGALLTAIVLYRR